MKKLLLGLCVLLTLCTSAFADEVDKSDVATDYQAVLGGGNAVVELTDHTVMAAVANLKVYPEKLFCNPYGQRAGFSDYAPL